MSDVVKLKTLLLSQPQNGYSPISVSESTGKWVLSLSALNGGSVDTQHIKAVAADNEQVERFMLQRGDFLISRSNTLQKVGKVGICDDDIHSIAYPDLMMRFRPDTSKINPYYLLVQLNSPTVIRYIRKHATGTSSSMKKINQEIVQNIPIVFLDSRTQEKVVALWRLWSDYIARINQLILLKQQYLDAMRSLLIIGTSADYQPVGSFIHEVSTRNKDLKYHRVLSVTNRKGFVLSQEQFERRVASTNVAAYKVIKRGQYAYNPSRINVGSIARLDNWNDGILSPMYSVFELDEPKVNSDYFRHWLSLPESRQRIRLAARGSVRETVAFNDLASIQMPLAPMTQQQKNAALLNMIEREISLLKQLAKKYNAQKYGLVHNLSAGELPGGDGV